MSLRLYILNFAGLCFVIWAYSLGYPQFVYAHDVSRISYLITAIFAGAVISSFVKGSQHLDRYEIWLVTLGLIGNIIGFIIALQHIDTSSLGSAEGVQRVASDLLSGMGTAFCSSLVGAVGALWLNICAWVLHDKTS